MAVTEDRTIVVTQRAVTSPGEDGPLLIAGRKVLGVSIGDYEVPPDMIAGVEITADAELTLPKLTLIGPVVFRYVDGEGNEVPCTTPSN